MGKKKCALLDTDFISKLHFTRKDDDNRFIDRVLELPGYQFACHEQIVVELGRYNTEVIDWMRHRIDEGSIQQLSDKKLIEELSTTYGANATSMFLYYLNNACNLFDSTFYDISYASLEQKKGLPIKEFIAEIENCDSSVGYDYNLGEIKTFLLQQVLCNREETEIYVFCSDDRKARVGLTYGGGIPGISALSSFYVLKERLGIEKAEAKIYFDSWMELHQKRNQTCFKVHKATKEQQLLKMDGYEIFDKIYDGKISIAVDGDLLLKEI